MGYRTDFTLTVDSGDLEEIVDKLNEISGYEFDRGFGQATCYEIKWYDYDEDMRKLSTMFPDVLMTLDGAGEESGDIWRNYYKNGKCQNAYANIVYDEFNEASLR